MASQRQRMFASAGRQCGGRNDSLACISGRRGLASRPVRERERVYRQISPPVVCAMSTMASAAAPISREHKHSDSNGPATMAGRQAGMATRAGNGENVYSWICA